MISACPNLCGAGANYVFLRKKESQKQAVLAIGGAIASPFGQIQS